MSSVDKTLRERVFHAVLYEVCAMVLLVPLGSWLLGTSPLHLGGLAILLSTLAMSWNMLFNWGFEALERHYGWQRTPRIRTLHAIGFEGGLVVLSIPLVAGWMEISYLEALLMDIGILLFFLPYTYVFNWCYDHARAWHLGRRASPSAG